MRALFVGEQVDPGGHEHREITQLDHASGVGLWLVKWIVEGYGGRIDFEESEWGGSAVVLDLPRISS